MGILAHIFLDLLFLMLYFVRPLSFLNQPLNEVHLIRGIGSFDLFDFLVSLVVAHLQFVFAELLLLQ